MTRRGPAPSFHRKRDPETPEEWDELAAYLGVESGAVLREQIALADEIVAEIIREEKATEPN